MRRVPKRHRVVERFWIFILKLQLPTCSSVGRFVDARRGAVADTQNVSSVAINGINIAEIELVSSDGERLPGRTSINTAYSCAHRSAGPDNLLGHRTDTT